MDTLKLLSSYLKSEWEEGGRAERYKNAMTFLLQKGCEYVQVGGLQCYDIPTLEGVSECLQIKRVTT